MGNLHSFRLKNFIFIAIFPELIDFVCNFLQRQKTARFSTQWMQTAINVCAVCHPNAAGENCCGLPYAGQKGAFPSRETAWGGDQVEWGHQSRQWQIQSFCFGEDEMHVQRQPVNISSFKKRKVTIRCNPKMTPCLLLLSN